MRHYLYFFLSFVLLSCSSDRDDDIDPAQLLLVVDGFEAELTQGTLTFQSGSDIHKVMLEQSEQKLIADLQSVPEGEYELTLSLFIGSNYLEEKEGARGKMFKGFEALGEVNLDGTKTEITINGPSNGDSRPDLSVEWSDRFFHVFYDEQVNGQEIIWSIPTYPCVYDMRFIPDFVDRTPSYLYIDYFVFGENGGSEALGTDECFSNCDLFSFTETFTDRLQSDTEANNLCLAKDWSHADCMLIVDFGEDVEDVYFFMRWNTEGVDIDFLQ